MDVFLETTVAEWKLGISRSWSVIQDRYGWMVYSFMLIVALFFLESSVTISKDGSIHAVIGGPASWFGLAGAVGLCLDAIRKRKHYEKTVGGKIKNDDVVFYRFRDTGFEYGIRGAWTNYYSWKLVTRIDVKRGSFVFELPSARITARTDCLQHEEVAELKEFFGKERDLILPEPFFGWRKSTAGKESYGAMKV